MDKPLGRCNSCQPHIVYNLSHRSRAPLLGAPWAELDFSIWSCTVNKPQPAVPSFQPSASASSASRGRPSAPQKTMSSAKRDRMERRRRASENNRAGHSMMTTLDVCYRPEVRPAADVTTAKTVAAVIRQPRVRPVQMPKGGEQ